jgi:uncharacterized membrane protein
MHACTYMHRCIPTSIHKHTHIHAYRYIHTCIHTHTYRYIHTNTCKHTCIHTYIRHICLYVYVCSTSTLVGWKRPVLNSNILLLSGPRHAYSYVVVSTGPCKQIQVSTSSKTRKFPSKWFLIQQSSYHQHCIRFQQRRELDHKKQVFMCVYVGARACVSALMCVCKHEQHVRDTCVCIHVYTCFINTFTIWYT